MLQSVTSPIELEVSMPIKHLNQTDLATRWSVSPRTLERWRYDGDGPAYLKLGSRVVYRLEDIEAYEARLRQKVLAKNAKLQAQTTASAGAAQ